MEQKQKFQFQDTMTSEILVIDDNPDIRNLITALLKDNGFNIREAANFDQATSPSPTDT